MQINTVNKKTVIHNVSLIDLDDGKELTISITGKAKTGKTTLAIALAEFLEQLGFSYVVTDSDETDKHFLGELIKNRGDILNKMTLETKININCFQHEKKLEPCS